MSISTSCSNLESLFPLDFITDLKEADKTLVFESIKNFKNPSHKPSNIQFLEGRDIHILTEFYTRYGETIRFVILIE
jgi:hypothetical protein